MANRLWRIGKWQTDMAKWHHIPKCNFYTLFSKIKHKASMGIFPNLNNEKCFFDVEACQPTVGHETLLERVWHFFPGQKMTVYFIIINFIFFMWMSQHIIEFTNTAFCFKSFTKHGQFSSRVFTMSLLFFCNPRLWTFSPWFVFVFQSLVSSNKNETNNLKFRSFKGRDHGHSSPINAWMPLTNRSKHFVNRFSNMSD